MTYIPKHVVHGLCLSCVPVLESPTCKVVSQIEHVVEVGHLRHIKMRLRTIEYENELLYEGMSKQSTLSGRTRSWSKLRAA